MKFGLNEIFDALEIAFSVKKAALVLVGLIVALLGSALFFWLGTLSSGLLAWLANAAGTVLLYVLVMWLHGAVSVMAYKELTSGEKIEPVQAVSLAKSNLKSLLLTPLMAVLAAALVLGIEYLVFMLGRFYAGQLAISLISGILIFVNAAVILGLIIGFFLITEMITVDASGPVASFKKLLDVAKKASLQAVMYFVPVLLIGAGVVISGSMLLFSSTLVSLSLFGTASGIFADMAASEVPTFSVYTQASWAIFSVFTGLLSGLLLSFAIVFVKTSCISIYLSLKQRLK